MPTRNMITANQSIFHRLDEFCAIRSDPVRNAGNPRWIATNSEDKRFLKNAEAMAKLSLAPSIKLAHYILDDRSYLVVSGLEISDPPANLDQQKCGGGVLTLFLAEEAPVSSASTAQIRDSVEVDDGTKNTQFAGYDPAQIASLFPPIQVFSCIKLEPDESYKTFFVLALYSKPVLSIQDEQCIRTIRTLTELNSQAIPYQTLCRSILDSDPSSLFLALYRCLEALYAYSHCESLKQRLGLETHWPELAATLEDVLDWHPREEPGLASILNYANSANLERIAATFNEVILDNVILHNFVAKRIYRLRNELVHYRPFQQTSNQQNVDWGRISEALAILIFDIYARISSSSAPILQINAQASKPDRAGCPSS